MIIYHTHHIVPKHMGGTDDSTNLVRLTVEEHAQAHLELYEKYGDERDLVAHRMLLGQITKAEAIKIIQKLPKSEAWKAKARLRTGEKNGMYGKKQSEKQKKAVSIANSVSKPHVSQNMKNLHAENKAYKFSKEDLAKAGRKTAFRKWYNNGQVNKYINDGDAIPEGFIRGRITNWNTHP
jgi:hypothetical protein